MRNPNMVVLLGTLRFARAAGEFAMVRISLVSKEAWGVGVGVEKHFFSEHFYYRVGIVCCLSRARA